MGAAPPVRRLEGPGASARRPYVAPARRRPRRRAQNAAGRCASAATITTGSSPARRRSPSRRRSCARRAPPWWATPSYSPVTPVSASMTSGVATCRPRRSKTGRLVSNRPTRHRSVHSRRSVHSIGDQTVLDQPASSAARAWTIAGHAGVRGAPRQPPLGRDEVAAVGHLQLRDRGVEVRGVPQDRHHGTDGRGHPQSVDGAPRSATGEPLLVQLEARLRAQAPGRRDDRHRQRSSRRRRARRTSGPRATSAPPSRSPPRSPGSSTPTSATRCAGVVSTYAGT